MIKKFVKGGINLNRYLVLTNSKSDPYAYDRYEHEAIHGLLGFKIVMLEHKYNTDYQFDQKEIENNRAFYMAGKKAEEELAKKLNDNASKLGVAFYLLTHGKMMVKMTKNGNFTPKLYTVSITINQLCTTLNVSKITVRFVYNAFRSTKLGINLSGKFIVSPLLKYSGGAVTKHKSYNYFKRIFNKQIKTYMRNKINRTKKAK